MGYIVIPYGGDNKMETEMSYEMKKEKHGSNAMDYPATYNPTSAPSIQAGGQPALSELYDDIGDFVFSINEAVANTEALVERLFGLQVRDTADHSGAQERPVNGTLDAISAKMHLARTAITQLNTQLAKLARL